MKKAAPNVSLLTWICGHTRFQMNQNLQASFFFCLLHQTEQSTAATFCSLHVGISPCCCSVCDLRRGREPDLSLLSPPVCWQLWKGSTQWKFFVCLHALECFRKHGLEILSQYHSKNVNGCCFLKVVLSDYAGKIYWGRIVLFSGLGQTQTKISWFLLHLHLKHMRVSKLAFSQKAELKTWMGLLSLLCAPVMAWVFPTHPTL